MNIDYSQSIYIYLYANYPPKKFIIYGGIMYVLVIASIIVRSPKWNNIKIHFFEVRKIVNSSSLFDNKEGPVNT